ncbi:MAG: BrnT family toxin [Terriglobales bacterium]
MRFVWDEPKSRQNLAKHKVGFELAASAFDPASS